MNWRYLTILFEFQKDGILGDRYIDDDEMERILNEQGAQGWELVNVTPVQEGLLAFLKKALPPQVRTAGIRTAAIEPTEAKEGIAGGQKQPVRQKKAAAEEGKTPDSGGQQPDDTIGGIKIS